MNSNNHPPQNMNEEAFESSVIVRAFPFVVAVVILAFLPTVMTSMYMLHVFILIFIYVLAAISLRTITLSGQFPLAHAAFMGIGAYLAGMASKWLGWPSALTIPLAALSTAALGVLLGFPFIRLRSLYYAMGSLFFGIGILQVIYALGKWTGGYSGLVGIRPLFRGGKLPYYYFFLTLTVLGGVALYRFEFSRIGTTLKAIAQSHIVAASVGINEGVYRILAVGVGCFFAGLAGAGYAHYNLVLSTSSFNFTATLWLVMYVLIGGVENFSGPIIGTFILILIPELFRDLKTYSPFVSAAILGVVVYCMPNGLAGLAETIAIRIRYWWRDRKRSHDA